MTDPNDKMLDDLFAQASAANPQVSDDLMARVLADAGAAQQPDPARAPMPGLWPRLLDVIGGWPAVSGLAAATVAGVWIGVSPPAVLDSYAAGLVGDAVTVSLFSDADLFDDGGLGDG